MAKRILIITHRNERHYYFCNRIIENTERVVGVITGAKQLNRSIVAKIKSKAKWPRAICYLRNRALNLVFASTWQALMREKSQAEQDAFNGAHRAFSAKHSHLHTIEVASSSTSINDQRYLDVIKTLRPDVIVVMGSCLLHKAIVRSAPLVLNLHTGLSPYYRGGYTNLFPFVENDYGVFGVTIHKMSPKIDGGQIVYSARPQISLHDTFSSINAKCIKLGIDLMLRALADYDTGEISCTPQWTSGKLFNSWNLNALIARKYFKVREQYLRRYLEMERKGDFKDILVLEPNSDTKLPAMGE